MFERMVRYGFSHKVLLCLVYRDEKKAELVLIQLHGLNIFSKIDYLQELTMHEKQNVCWQLSINGWVNVEQQIAHVSMSSNLASLSLSVKFLSNWNRLKSVLKHLLDRWHFSLTVSTTAEWTQKMCLWSNHLTSHSLFSSSPLYFDKLVLTFLFDQGEIKGSRRWACTHHDLWVCFSRFNGEVFALEQWNQTRLRSSWSDQKIKTLKINRILKLNLWVRKFSLQI